MKNMYYNIDLKECIILCLGVDDIPFFGSNIEIVNDIKDYLSINLEMKDLGEKHIILGMRLSRTSEGITLNQSSAIEKILRKLNHFDSKPIFTPHDFNMLI